MRCSLIASNAELGSASGMCGGSKHGRERHEGRVAAGAIGESDRGIGFLRRQRVLPLPPRDHQLERGIDDAEEASVHPDIDHAPMLTLVLATSV